MAPQQQPSDAWQPPIRSRSLANKRIPPPALSGRRRQPTDESMQMRELPELHITLASPSADSLHRTTTASEKDGKTDSTDSLSMDPAPSSTPELPPIRPTVRLLFSLSTKRELILYPLPALCLSLFSGILPPYITTILGDAFNVFGTFVAVQSSTSSPSALEPARQKLRDDMLIIMIKLLAIAGITLIANVAALSLWSWFGETVSRHIRRRVYTGVSTMQLEWFDTGMGKKRKADTEDEDVKTSEKAAKTATSDLDGPGGEASGGLTGRFSRESDDVRMAAGQNIGQIFQYSCTFLATFILAMITSYQLTLVILAGFPLTVIFTIITERYAAPQVIADRDLTAVAAGRVERVVGAISTVKAFNAEKYEVDAVVGITKKVQRAYDILSVIYGYRLGISQFLVMSMFVQGFWFGGYLVSEGKLNAGEVSVVFWACLLAASHIQYILPLLNQLERGKIGMAGLLELSRHPVPRAPSSSTMPQSNTTPPTSASAIVVQFRPVTRAHATLRDLRKITPNKFTGELALRNVTFHYPARPHPAAPALTDVTMFIPACETTFIVGQSGSGKSTIGALLMGLYAYETGRIEVDEQGIEWLDQEWLRAHIGMVSQGASVLFEGTVHDNVAMGVVGNGTGRSMHEVTREEVFEACRAALIHDFIRDLPDGYETVMSGEKGASLSGGQRQRIAIARAWIRNPTVLILDEATSALDATSRLLVYEALKRWRTNRTTIVITHDLSPIVDTDFVYVMRDGRVVEHGYRSQLVAKADGWFTEMLRVQQPEDVESADAKAIGWAQADDEAPWRERDGRRTTMFQTAGFLRPNLPDTEYLAAPAGYGDRSSLRMSRHASYSATDAYLRDMPPSYLSEPMPSFARRGSDMSMLALERVGETATAARQQVVRRRPPGEVMATGSEKGEAIIEVDATAKPPPRPMSFFIFVRTFFPLIPRKFRMFLGFFFCICTGSVTPIFSSFLSQLLAALTPGSNVNQIRTSLIVLALAAADGISQGLKFTLLQQVAMAWITRMREMAFSRAIVQDKSWFDESQNSVTSIVNIIVKDAEDARNIVGLVLGQALAVMTMLGLGLIWALIVGWELTLVGFAVGPVCLCGMYFSTRLVDAFERRNKALREQVAKKFHETISNVRAIRSMSLEPVFLGQFNNALEANFRLQMRAAPLNGLAYAVAACVPCIAEALMFYVGAILVANGRYSFEQMLQTFSLMIFSVSFAAQLLSYVPTVSKSFRAAIDMLRLLELSLDTAESKGSAKARVTGHVSFRNVSFAYPSRPDVQVLRDLSLDVRPGECVCIVGASGSGKSTVAALLQRLYEPTEGRILLDGHPLSGSDVHYLRDHLAVVSQHPALFDMAIADNIAYGLDAKEHDATLIAPTAARKAHIHEWITSLPGGYKTALGENASLVSGGQAQRLQIARALAREREVLILDECTSALDTANSAAVMKTIAEVKQGRTTIVVTHKLDMMKMCDRLVVMQDGRVVETGTFDALTKQRGVFAALASSGEWQV